MAHRHSAALDVAEAALRSISEDAVSKRRSVESQSDGSVTKGGPLDGLTREGAQGQWEYLGTQKGVRIYTKGVGEEIQVKGYHAEQRAAEAGSSRLQDGGSDAGLPYFRGEGLIEGDWKLSDLVATIASPGARDVWDERFRAGSSQVTAILSDRDALLHSSIVSPFPVGPRDTVVAARHIQDSANQAFYASTSVEDPLVPQGSVIRNRVKLSGWVFRKVSPDESDELEIMAQDDEEEAFAANARRPHHQKAFSRQFDPLSNALPNLTRHKTLLSSPPDKRAGRPGISHRHSNSLAFATSEAARAQRAASPAVCVKPKGIRTTFVLKTNPGGSLPVTFINSLNVSLPLCIDFLSKYLKLYGFAPHLVSRRGLKLLQEKFEAPAGQYSLIFRPLQDAPRQVQLRYHGLTFEGRCDIAVKGAEWSLSHDVAAPPTQPESGGRPRLRQRFSTSATLQRVNDEADPETDAARLPGHEGACTLTLVLEPDVSIVQVTLTKRAPKDAERGVAYVVQIGAAMTRARATAEKEMEDLEEERFGQVKRAHPTISQESEEGETEIERADIMARALEESFATVRNAAGLQKAARQRDSLQELRSGTATPVRWH